MTQWVPYRMNNGLTMYWGMMDGQSTGDPGLQLEQTVEVRQQRITDGQREWRELGPVGRTQRFVDQGLPPHPDDARELLAILRTEQLGHSTAIAALRLLSSVMDLVYVTGPGSSMAQFLSAWSHARSVLAADGKDQAPKPAAETPP
jgi:hypothetical protein